MSRPATPKDAAHTIENLFMFPAPIIMELINLASALFNRPLLNGTPVRFKSDLIGLV
jgi:hypothetical protein